MNYPAINKLKGKLYFTLEDVSSSFGIRPESARVLCSRYVRQGIFTRLKNNFYTLSDKWENMGRVDFLRIANMLQVPSYISFLTALSYYEVTTQVPRSFFESASLKRTAEFSVRKSIFNFYKIKKEYFFDFSKKDGVFIASKEKAFVDAVYLISFGKYSLDVNALDLGKIDGKRIKVIMKSYPQRTQNILKKICKI